MVLENEQDPRKVLENSALVYDPMVLKKNEVTNEVFKDLKAFRNTTAVVLNGNEILGREVRILSFVN